MNDPISRQAAIDALDSIGSLDTDADREYARKVFEALPSAQPEIIHCRDCKYHDKGSNESDSWNLCGYRPWLYVTTDDEHYCGYAERRTDEQTD